MKALSIRQPWAWAIFHGKPVENRTRPSRYTGPLLIHASKTFDGFGYGWLLGNLKLLTGDLPHPDDYKFGGFIGIVDMVDCVDNYRSPFFTGPWGYVFEHPKETPFMLYKGQLGIFNVPIESMADPNVWTPKI